MALATTDIFIPARAGSSRFPNKPLAPLAGRTVLAHSVAIARAAAPAARLTVLSDSDAILQHARALGAHALNVDADCHNGTERMAHALAARSDAAPVAVNFQGDAVLVPPAVLEATVAAAHRERSCEAVTPVVPLGRAAFDDYCQKKAAGRASGTLAVGRADGVALWFSKGILPTWRSEPADGVWGWRHVGLYAMRPAAAARYLQLEPRPWEAAEGLEQLRWLEHGLPLRLLRVPMEGRTLWSIDHPEDLAVAEAIIAREGPLCAPIEAAR